ncbi:MAG: glycosyltransferase family 39 protein [Fusobacteria bacterium]|nr:glycosyltransferase family 39 protein [Fusobacteriota bacterium]
MRSINWKKKVVATIIIFAIIHICLSFFLNVTDDEAYYWVWSQNIHLSYFDHPPLVAYMIWISTHIFGNNQVAIRIPTILILSLVSWIMYKTYMYLYNDSKRGFVLVLIINILPIYFIMTGFMMLPDSPLILFFTLSLYYFLKLLKENRANLWYMMGILVGLGLYSKYYMFFTYVSIFVTLLLYKEYRVHFKKVQLYIGLILSILIFSPVIIWNADHQWASFIFQFYSRQGHSGIKVFLTGQFIGGQLLLVTPLLFLGLFAMMYKARKERDTQLLIIYGALYFVVFLIASLKTDTKLNWAICSYIPFIVVFVRYMKWGFFWKLFAVIIPAILTLFIMIVVIFPIVNIPNDSNVLMDLHGWQMVGSEVESTYTALSIQNPGEWFLCGSRYQVAGKLNLYLPHHEYVYSLNNELDGYKFLRSDKDLVGKNAIYVTQSFYYDIPQNLYNAQSFQLLKTIPIYEYGVVRRVYYVYEIIDFQGVK